jgi:hypothetical protein
MRARDRDAPDGAGADHGLAHGLVGIGDAQVCVPATVDVAADRAGGKAGRMLRRFADLPDGTFVWSRTSDGRFRLGRIVGSWRYDDSTAARAVGIHHVRPAEWLPRAFSAGETPAAVRATFARGGRNLQRIHADAAERETAARWDAHHRAD